MAAALVQVECAEKRGGLLASTSSAIRRVASSSGPQLVLSHDPTEGAAVDHCFALAAFGVRVFAAAGGGASIVGPDLSRRQPRFAARVGGRNLRVSLEVCQRRHFSYGARGRVSRRHGAESSAPAATFFVPQPRASGAPS